MPPQHWSLRRPTPRASRLDLFHSICKQTLETLLTLTSRKDGFPGSDPYLHFIVNWADETQGNAFSPTPIHGLR